MTRESQEPPRTLSTFSAQNAYVELLRDSRGLRRDQREAREAWFSRLAEEKKEEPAKAEEAKPEEKKEEAKPAEEKKDEAPKDEAKPAEEKKDEPAKAEEAKPAEEKKAEESK